MREIEKDCLFLTLSVCLSRLIHIYVLVNLYFFTIQITKHVHVFLHYTKHVHACMHISHYQNWERNNLGGGGKIFWVGNGIGGKTTRVWGAKRPRLKIEAKRHGWKRLGGNVLGTKRLVTLSARHTKPCPWPKLLYLGRKPINSYCLCSDNFCCKSIPSCNCPGKERKFQPVLICIRMVILKGV